MSEYDLDKKTLDDSLFIEKNLNEMVKVGTGLELKHTNMLIVNIYSLDFFILFNRNNIYNNEAVKNFHNQTSKQVIFTPFKIRISAIPKSVPPSRGNRTVNSSALRHQTSPWPFYVRLYLSVSLCPDFQ